MIPENSGGEFVEKKCCRKKGYDREGKPELMSPQLKN
jgi:hypothetical protein